MGSSRFPNKVLHKLAGKPLLAYSIERLSQCRQLDRVVIATSSSEPDREIIEFASEHEIEAYSGSEDDVLDRYYQTATAVEAETIVRITGDCPFIDPQLVGRVVDVYLQGRQSYDYVHNGETFPEGLCETEVFPLSILERAWQEATLPSEREHVTAYINKNPDLFRIHTVENHQDFGFLRFAVDEREDLQFLEVLLQHLPDDRMFHQEDILNIYKAHPEIFQINSHIQRNEGYTRSVRSDQSNS